MSTPEQLLRQACIQLIEHFDTVQIIATDRDGEDGSTTCHNEGRGNWFARKGSVEHWLLTEDESVKEKVRICENIEDEEDEEKNEKE